MLNSLAAVGFSSTLSTAPLPVFPPGRCPGAVRYAPGLSFGVGDVAKLPVVQSIWNEFVGADGAQLVPDETYFDKAENAATLILKSDRTTEETAEVKPFIRDLCVSIHTIDTPVSNQEVRELSRARSLQVGAGLWGLAIAVQKRCVYMFGQVVCPWWIVGIVISLMQWAFYVDKKSSLIANARTLYKNKARRA